MLSLFRGDGAYLSVRLTEEAALVTKLGDSFYDLQGGWGRGAVRHAGIVAHVTEHVGHEGMTTSS